MTETTVPTMGAAAGQVQYLETLLKEAGWTQATPAGELATPDRKLWFSKSYVTGEYTVHAYHREKGAGVPRGNIRVRITPALVASSPGIGRALAHDLIRAAGVKDNRGFAAMTWPPSIWESLSNEGIVDIR